jgi:hypothetical protein
MPRKKVNPGARRRSLTPQEVVLAILGQNDINHEGVWAALRLGTGQVIQKGWELRLPPKRKIQKAARIFRDRLLAQTVRNGSEITVGGAPIHVTVFEARVRRLNALIRGQF